MQSSKLLLIEGIPGSGKTTISTKINEWYLGKNIPARLYNEGIANPVDLAWCAYVPIGQYNSLLEKYDSIRDRIKERTTIEGDYAIVEYTQVHCGTDFYNDLENYEIYGGRVSTEQYLEITLRRWRTFGTKSPTEVSIMESALLQNTVMELLFYRCISEADIISHALTLVDYVKTFAPVVIYLSQPDVGKTIQHIANERSSPYGRWIDNKIIYCEKTPYAQKHGIKGFDGVIKMIEMRKNLEKAILAQVPSAVIIEKVDDDWDAVWDRVSDVLKIAVK